MKIESKKGGYRSVFQIGVITPCNLVKKGLHLEFIVVACVQRTGGPDQAKSIGGIDLRGVKIGNSLPRRSILQFLGGMLVTPRRVTACGANNFKEGVDLEKIVRVNRKQVELKFHKVR